MPGIRSGHLWFKLHHFFLKINKSFNQKGKKNKVNTDYTRLDNMLDEYMNPLNWTHYKSTQKIPSEINIIYNIRLYKLKK